MAEPVVAYAPAASVPDAAGVHVQAVAPATHVFAEPAPAPMQRHDHFEPGPFIPPAPESPVIRPQRMPQIEDLPLPAQAQIRAQRGELPAEAPEVKRRTLLERLASFGMSRQDEVGHPAELRHQQVNLPAASGGSSYRTAQPGAVHAEYAKRNATAPAQRPAPQPLDAHGRISQQRAAEEDQLEIPAFLRRQSS
jgi:cell division protein FtsZ